MPEAQDEYDCCLGEIFQLLTTGGTDEQIVDYLWQHMELSIGREQMVVNLSSS